MQYGLTKSLITRLKITKIEKGILDNPAFIWDATYTDISGKKVLLVMHADTKYVLVFTDIKPYIWKNFTDFMDYAVTIALLNEGFDQEEIKKYFKMAQESKLTTTHGKKVVGGLNKIAIDLECYDKPLVEGMYQPLISEISNGILYSDPFRPENKYIVPKDFFKKQMSRLLR